jgi:hypothetical protein
MSTTIFASICFALGLSAQAPAAKNSERNAGAERLEFMKESARSYTMAIERDQKTVLKLQPDPVFRLGNQGDGMVLEGAIFLGADEVGRPGAAAQLFLIFAFVLATDPEIFLFVEARPGAGALEWQYAFAPMTCWELKAEHKGQPVWSLPLRSTDDPSKPFFDRTDRP